MAPTVALMLLALAPVAERTKAFDALVAEHWEYTLKAQPELATILGDKRYNDRLTDASQAQVDRDLAAAKGFLTRFEAVDPSGFPEQSALSLKLMLRNLKEQLAAAQFRDWEMPFNQMSGAHIELPQLVPQLPFDTVKDYDDYVARLGQIPRVFAQNTENMKAGLKRGYLPPKFLLEKVAAQAKELGSFAPEQSPFAQPLSKFPKAVPAADQKRLKAAVLAAIKDQVNPAYLKLHAFVKDEYAPKGRAEPGIWALPDGEARYVFAAARNTTTPMAPEAIHQLGLAQVKELEDQMLVIAKKLGHPDVKSLNAAIAKDPKLHGQSRKQILDEYQRYTDAMWKKLPTLFGRLPKAALKIMPIEEFNEKTGATHYNQGTPDGTRPGHVMVNTGDWTNRLLITNESTAYHEGVPGHHMQVSIAQELEGLPPFRQQASYTAYQEGWALYSERLGKEVGGYADPYSDYGRLQDEMLRAIRLVVDTGLHLKKWNRQQVVDYFHAHSNIDEPDVQSETDRYIVWPGQALAYKIGQLTILRLRDEAQKALGAKFDVKGFHDEILGSGALPLELLEARVRAWVAAQQKPAPVK